MACSPGSCGVYVRDEDGTPFFVPAPPLTDDDVRTIVETTAQRVVRLCERRGLCEAGTTDPLWEQEPLLVQISAASVQDMVATGDRAGRKVRRRLTDPEDGVRSGALCCASLGFSLHAATRIEATDRRRLERLCRHVIRPPVANGRLRFVDEATLAFTLKTPWAEMVRARSCCPHRNYWRNWPPSCRRRDSTWSDTTACWRRPRQIKPRSYRVPVP